MSKERITEIYSQQYATFDLGTARATGIVLPNQTGKKTIRVQVVSCNRKKPTDYHLNKTKKGTPIKRHIKKHRVEIFPKGVVPNIDLEK